MRITIVVALVFVVDAGFIRAEEAPAARAEMRDLDGQKIGQALLEETPQGVLITMDLANLAPGTRALHIHETGKCEPPFKTAGGHFNPTGKKHGLKSAAGKHGGDLPNITIGRDGNAKVQLLATDVTLRRGEKRSLFDADGSALVIHAEVDDHKTDPAGAAGARIACGVVTAKK